MTAVSAAAVVPSKLPSPPSGRTVVVGAGKAAAAMARAVELDWRGALSGLVVTPYGHGVACERVEVLEAAHPLPDEAGRAAASRVLAQVAGLTGDDLVLCLVSGGGSSLLALPAPGVELADEREIGAALLRSGAPITALNCVRKHLSAITGGRLAVAAWPAPVFAMVISDVPGDDPSVIASGPTVADPTTYQAALDVLEQYGIAAPPGVARHLRAGAAGGPGAPRETPKPGDPRLARRAHSRAGHRRRRSRGGGRARPSRAACGPSSWAIASKARPARSAAGTPNTRWRSWTGARRTDQPTLLLSGGETTVTVRGDGRGGRNTEYLLGLALGLGGRPGIYALAADTDGIDGSRDNAGAFVAPDTLARAAAAGLDPHAVLARNDAYTLFARLGDLFLTGPTLTNVNDFRAILVGGRDRR